ncbi:DinB family protein [Sphingobacterium griseoflavum]|uniref:DinB-like domain-containing protein n=1 Tax=Sphingobacterium griseoflavum TaxID=1474952 RepID=A0ABQ3I0P1_9SPHI|nr:DinB family protein [Sphingobacterium griseoflavum]GHE42299.1 hypothetical protein GCM10017764_26950 [Sphingobacterium griseoflavum]
MKKQKQPEVWMRGPLPNIPILLQPVAHALLQVEEDIQGILQNVKEEQLWESPAGAACIAFHIQHITGVIDRMFTYARNERLTDLQFDDLKREGKQRTGIDKKCLLKDLSERMEQALQELATTPVSELGEARYLGRKRIPTTLIGLLFHAAEHSQRHFGQLLVKEKWLNA